MHQTFPVEGQYFLKFKIKHTASSTWMSADNRGAIISDNAGFTLTFWLVASSPQAKMCPERLPEEHKNKRPACATRASSARSGRARDPTKWSRAQQVKLVGRSEPIGLPK
jgi:hypothetical protein